MRLGLFILTITILAAPLLAQQRFTVPSEFDSGYERPDTEFPPPREGYWNAIDIVVLVVALAVGTFLVLKVRRRWPILVTMLMALLYFGFFRGGCICPVGAIQYVATAVVRSDYTIPLVVLIFFVLPVGLTLIFGRTFCGTVCPLGAVQDAVLIRPLRIPSWLAYGLGLLAYVYLGLAVLLAVTDSDMVICRYDPFVALFHLLPLGKWVGASPEVPGGVSGIVGGVYTLALTAAFLVIVAFVGRAYCRFLCPLGAVFRPLSALSRWRTKITPDKCVQCRLCEDACPFGAIRKPTNPAERIPRNAGKGRLAVLIVLVPVLTAGAGFLGSRLVVPMSRANYTVELAEKVRAQEAGLAERTHDPTDPGEAFRRTDTLASELYAEAANIRGQFRAGGWILGGFLGLVVSVKLLRTAVRRRRDDYEPDPAICMSCGRCYEYCPVERARRKGNRIE